MSDHNIDIELLAEELYVDEEQCDLSQVMLNLDLEFKTGSGDSDVMALLKEVRERVGFSDFEEFIEDLASALAKHVQPKE
jgi:hypothetical protein